jgi:hypothetical protein
VRARCAYRDTGAPEYDDPGNAIALCRGTATPQVVSFPSQTAQHARVVLTAGETPYWSSIDEFYLYSS